MVTKVGLDNKRRVCGVYAIKNTVNGKFYVGSSVNIKQRWYDHCWRLNHNTTNNIKTTSFLVILWRGCIYIYGA